MGIPEADVRSAIREIRRIKGYLHLRDAAVIAHLLDAQKRAGISGGVAEIGVHHGLLFLLLCLHLAPGERGVAVDLFGNQEMNAERSGRGDLDIFLGHAKRLGLTDRIHVVQSESTALSATVLMEGAGSPLRAISVDGGHSYDVVLSDLQLAAGCLAPGGVIIVDDYFNYGWPDVSHATNAFLMRRPDMIPFAVTAAKLLLTNDRGAADAYLTDLATRAAPRMEKRQMMGIHPVAVFDTRGLSQMKTLATRLARNFVIEQRQKIAGPRARG
jgi:hypothetical protein